MNHLMRIIVLILIAALGDAPSGAAAPRPSLPDYGTIIDRTAAMVGDARAQELARASGLSILNVTWEDTGRYKGSSVGPNISDMTIQVQRRDPATGQYRLTCMPVIRHPNFSDESADCRPDQFFLLVGNERGAPLKKISLKEYLANPRAYMSVPGSWKGPRRSLLARRDSHVLVSAQACFLPVPRRGIAEFNPVLFNYQSVSGDPAVLTILATREGTSMTVIDNKRDAFAAGMTWGQRLFFNQKGERASFTGTRLSDHANGRSTGRDHGDSAVTAAKERGLNMVLLIQVPLKQKRPPRYGAPAAMDCEMAKGAALPSQRSDVEAAVIGHGTVEGPYTEVDGNEIERDERFPIRVTVQFYKATSNGVVDERDVRDIAEQIGRIYREANYAGSLVVPHDTGRPTEYDGPKQEPPDWWQEFWKRHRGNTGMSRAETLRMLHTLMWPYRGPQVTR